MVASKRKYATFDDRNIKVAKRVPPKKPAKKKAPPLSPEGLAQRQAAAKAIAHLGRASRDARKLPVVDPEAAWHGTSEGWNDRMCGCLNCRRWNIRNKEEERIARAKARRKRLTDIHHHNGQRFKAGPAKTKNNQFARDIWAESDRRLQDKEWRKVITKYQNSAERKKRRQGAPPYAGKLAAEELKRLRVTKTEAAERMGIPSTMLGAFCNGNMHVTYSNDHVITRFAEVFRDVTSRAWRNRMAHYGFEPEDIQRYLFHCEAMHRAWNSRAFIGAKMSTAEKADHDWRYKPKAPSAEEAG